MAKRKKINNKIIVEAIAEGLRKGATISIACQMAGISEATYYLWRRMGRESEVENEYTRFNDLMDKAEAEGAMRHLEVINNAAIELGEWRASKWLLERRYPNSYGYSQTIKHQGDENAPIAATFSQAIDYRSDLLVDGDDDNDSSDTED